MATFLFDEIIFGPVKSRRLGVSLGVNLLPTGSKICSFDCIYCECGWTNSPSSTKLPSRTEVRAKMNQRLDQMKREGDVLDVITYAGNGEPTLHPQFAEIINDTVELRNSFFPKARIAVLSNSTMLHKQKVVAALKKVDQSILKLDSGFDSTIKHLNQPHTPTTVEDVINNLKQFDGNFTLQTLFVRGSYKNVTIDNTSHAEITRWLDIVEELKPKEVMIYTIARDTPISTLEKIPKEELDAIAYKVKKIGIPVQVSA